jgi:hypothetical protein
MARTTGAIITLGDAAADSADEHRQAAQQIAVGRGRPDPEQLTREFLRTQLPALQRAGERQQQFQLGTALPAQAALQRLASPPAPIGTGIAAANANEQERIEESAGRTRAIQEDLNDYYARGQSILADTYKVPPQLLGQITSIGQQIAGISANIANRQAQYQVAQYNFQLMIAKRTLGDIVGLTGQQFGSTSAQATRLGLLERENLALSRQAQLIQFTMAQRQINFQRAVAGFQVPGLTPAEQAARVEEAEIVTSFAQKQLNIQREMFGNQVQIVDINNLRQGADLAAQIALMLQGRKLTIDTQLAQEELGRLQTQQAILVEAAGTFLEKINNEASAVLNHIFQIESSGVRMADTITNRLFTNLRIGFSGLNEYIAQLPGVIGGAGASSSGGGGGTTGRIYPRAMGGVENITGPTNLLVGEAGDETVAILRNPRQMQAALGGGLSITLSFGDVHMSDERDMDMFVEKVINRMGREAALRGLRSPG